MGVLGVLRGLCFVFVTFQKVLGRLGFRGVGQAFFCKTPEVQEGGPEFCTPTHARCLKKRSEPPGELSLQFAHTW